MNDKFLYTDDYYIIGYRDNVLDYFEALIPSLDDDDDDEVIKYFKELISDIKSSVDEDDLIGFKTDVMDYELNTIERSEIGLIILDLIDRNIIKVKV